MTTATAQATRPVGAGMAPAVVQHADDPPLSRAACWQRIRETGEGRLIFRTEHGLRAIAVAYQVGAGTVVLRFPEFNEAAHYLVGEEASVEVISDDPDGRLWRIKITGYGEDLDEARTRACGVFDDLESWPASLRTRTIGIRPLLISTRRLPVAAARRR